MLKTLKIQNFTCLPAVELKFSPGLNVIVGENGTGKSHILKLAYAALRALSDPDTPVAKEPFARDFARHLVEVFKPDNLGRLHSRANSRSKCRIGVKIRRRKKGENELRGFACSFSSRHTEMVDMITLEEFNFEYKIPAPLFIPAKEILSVFPGFAQALRDREFKFDATYLDLADKLTASPLRKSRLDSIDEYLAPLEEILGGHIDLEKDAFYFYATSPQATNKKLEAQLMAEGHRKIGMLMHLLRTGGLAESCSLFWDEPEANLNPKLLKKLAEILVALSKIMQITIATHSLFLMRELEIHAENKQISGMRYFVLHLTENGVEIQQGNSSNEIGDITALDATIEQSRRYIDAGE